MRVTSPQSHTMTKRLTPLLALGLIASSPLAFGVPQDQTAQLNLAREVITSMHMDEQVKQMTSQISCLTSKAAGTSGTLSETDQKAAQALTEKVMNLALKEMLTKLDLIYAEVFTESELKAMKAFYQSPEGQSSLRKQPQVMQKLMPSVMEMSSKLAEQLGKELEKELGKSK